MNYRKLGNADFSVSEISFGCMSLGRNQANNKMLLRTAFDQGINFFDTADLYEKGENEVSVGKAFKGMRQDVMIATKVGNQWNNDGSGWIWNPGKSYILRAVQDSLKRLQTDYIDLYQLHGGTIDDPIDETIEAFEELMEKGLIRAYGISSIRPNVIREYVKRSGIVSVMTQYSLLDRRPEEFTLPFLAQNNVGVLVRGAVAKGLLVNKSPKEYLSHSMTDVANVQKQLEETFAQKRSPAQTAIRYCLDDRAVSSVVAGASNVNQLSENIATSKSIKLTNDERIQLRNLTPVYTYQSHR